MKSPIPLLCLAWLLGTTLDASAQVWRCEVDGRVLFSDRACAAGGHVLDGRRLHANTLQPGAVAAAPQAVPVAAAQASSLAVGGACPGEQEIRNIESKARSITLSAQERRFLHDEVRRARQCRKGQGDYTEADWQISREAQDDQGSLDQGRSARERAEGMHSAADPLEGDRIALRRVRP